MTIAAGTRLGPYEILARLGAGGMGEVYKARDTRLGRIVAIKVLPSGLAPSPEIRQRFEREAKVVVRTFPETVGKWQASIDGGLEVNTHVGEGTSSSLTVVLNWTAELKR